MGRLLVLAVLLGAVVVAAAAAPARATEAALTVRSSQYGRIVFDGRGFVLYAFTRDRRGASRCTGECARRWPPFVVARRPRAASGVRAKLIGTTRRADGRLQVTYRGRPLYYYVGDTKPGVILCQNAPEFGGLWLVVRPDGSPVR
jgi:predicted lipoprotein with Yx(FWY)xxD motif